MAVSLSTVFFMLHTAEHKIFPHYYIVGILIFIGKINFKLSSTEQENWYTGIFCYLYIH